MAIYLPYPASQGHSPRSIRMPRALSRRAAGRGFTLVEMLVALAVTLVMMGAVVTLFGVMAESVSDSRAGIEMSDRLRAARNQLQLDLGGITATIKPPLRPENDEGYFEIIEGPLSNRDLARDPVISLSGAMSLFGDVDDVLMFTTRSRGAPFRGRFNDGTVIRAIDSPTAEVLYFLAQDINSPPPVIDATITSPGVPTRLYTLYRRVLLVVPETGPWTLPYTPLGVGNHFFDENDISFHYTLPGGSPTLVANTLGDLTKRENRFARYFDTGVADGGFPFPINLSVVPVMPQVGPTSAPAAPGSWPTNRPKENAFLAPMEDKRLGDDILLANVLSFDVQVWDPGAPIFEYGGVAVEPNDPGWKTAVDSGPPTPIGFGAYVDMGYDPPSASGAPAMVFNRINPNLKDGFLSSPITLPRIYDTWSLHYEADGIDQDSSGAADEATDGLDSAPTNGVVDDITEFDTLPPYSAPLRGIRITIRVYEPDSQQVREAVVIQSFLPE